MMRTMRRTLALAVLLLATACKSESQKCQAASFEEDIPLCERACDKDDALSCDRLGYINMLYRHNAEATKAYSKACKLGNAESCAYIKK